MDLPARWGQPSGSVCGAQSSHPARKRAPCRACAKLICGFCADMQGRISLTGTAVNNEASMTTFDKREEGFEKQFAHDEELLFKANARRNKLLGLWAAEKLGLSGDAANAYAKEVVMSDFEESGDHDVFKKIRADLDAKGVTQSDQDIRRMMDELMAKAVAEIKASG